MRDPSGLVRGVVAKGAKGARKGAKPKKKGAKTGKILLETKIADCKGVKECI